MALKYVYIRRVNKKAIFILFIFVIGSLLFVLPSCKSCNKKEEVPALTADTTTFSLQPSNTLTLPHADTSLVPLLSAVLDDAFDASAKKDYNRLASLIVYRGPDERRMGYDVFTTKVKMEKGVVKATADVFNKWNSSADSREYIRTFEMDQPDGRTMPVMEVLFISSKKIERRFFGFFEINGQYKIADVTSYL